DGEAIYKERCASCHDQPAPRVPALSTLRGLSDVSINRSLETGSMKEQAAGLTSAERVAVAGFIAYPVMRAVPPPPACSVSPLKPGATWAAWGADDANSRYQRDAGLAPSDIPKLKLKW